MTIIRHGITAPDGDLPIISKVVQNGGLVYLCGVTPEPGGDIRSQTRQVLERIDHLLAEAPGPRLRRSAAVQAGVAGRNHGHRGTVAMTPPSTLLASDPEAS